MAYPKSPDILYSFINTKLRDSGLCFHILCDELDADPAQICRILESGGYVYDKNLGRFQMKADLKSTNADSAEKFKTKPSKYDPQGSYTGVGQTPQDLPVQDADDL